MRHNPFVLCVSFALLFLTSLTGLANTSHTDDFLNNTPPNISSSPPPPQLNKIRMRMDSWVALTLLESSKIRTSSNPKVESWRNAILSIKANNDLDLIRQINVITNRHVNYIPDYLQYHKDYWAPPYETLTQGGDCEDIALLKVAALHLHGFDVRHKAHLLVGMIDWQGASTAHAVLLVDLNHTHYAMRNITNDVVAFEKMTPIMLPLYIVDPDRITLFEDKRATAFLMQDLNLENITPAAGAESPTLGPPLDNCGTETP